MEVTLTIHARELALSHRHYERDPYLNAYCSWDHTKPPVRTASIPSNATAWSATLGTFRLPARDDPNGAMLTIEQHVNSSYSGNAEIDKRESKAGVVRTPKAGVARINLWQLVDAALSKGAKIAIVDVPFYDKMLSDDAMLKGVLAAAAGNQKVLADPVGQLGRERIAEIEAAVMSFAYKALYELHAEIQTPQQQYSTATFDGLAGVPLYLRDPEFARAMSKLEVAYMMVATDLPPLPGISAEQLARVRFAANPKDPLVGSLHLLNNDVPAGRAPAVTHIMEADDAPTMDLKSLELAFTGALLQRGLSPVHFVDIVEKQRLEKRKCLHAAYADAIAAIPVMATSVVTTINYTNDCRIPNMNWLAQQPLEKLAIYAPPLAAAIREGKVKKPSAADYPLRKFVTAPPAAVAALKRRVWPTFESPAVTLRNRRFAQLLKAKCSKSRRIGAPIHHVLYGDDSSAATTSKQVAYVPVDMVVELAVVNGESFDREQMAGGSNAGDCEDVGGGAARILISASRALERAAANKQTLSPLLQALRFVMRLYTMAMEGMTVSEPYVKTDASAPTPPEHKPLPLYGEEAAAGWQEGGHGVGFYIPIARLARMLERGVQATREWAGGDTERAQLLATLRRLIDEQPPWAELQPTLLAEGTGRVEPNIMPPAEAFAGMEGAEVYIKKKTVAIEFVRRLRDKTRPEGQELAELVRVETQPYEASARTDRRQHISPFYRTMVHLLLPEMIERVSPHFHHVITISAQQRVRGVPIADFLTHDPDVALVPYTAPSISEAEFRRTLLPGMKSFVAQLPQCNWASTAEMPPRRELAQPLVQQALQKLAAVDLSAAAAAAAATKTRAPLRDGATATATTTVVLPPGTATTTTTVLSAHFDSLEMVTRTPELGVLLAAHADPRRTTVSMTIPVDWKLPALGADKVTKALATLDRLKSKGEIVDYVLVRDHPLATVSNQVNLIVVVPVVVD